MSKGCLAPAPLSPSSHRDEGASKKPPSPLMKPFLRQQLARYADRLGELEFLLSREDIMKDMSQFMALSREHTDRKSVV